MTTAEIGGLTFHGFRDPSGLHFRRIVDWDSLSDAKDTPESRPGDHGTFRPEEDFREGLVITLEGWYRGTARVDALDMRRRLTGALADKDRRITVTDEFGPTSRDVSVRRVSLDDLVDTRFDFSIDMLAYDPRRYGPWSPTSTGIPVAAGGLVWPITWPITWTGGGADGRLTLSNPGTADSFPLLEITGGLDLGFSLTEVGTGREIRFERFIPTDSTVYLNPRTGSAAIDGPGNDVSGYLTRSDWFPVPSEGQSVIQFVPLGGVSGTPTVTARTAPAYW